MRTQYALLHFGKMVLDAPTFIGDPIRSVIVDDILEEICILSDLDIPKLEEPNVS